VSEQPVYEGPKEEDVEEPKKIIKSQKKHFKKPFQILQFQKLQYFLLHRFRHQKVPNVVYGCHLFLLENIKEQPVFLKILLKLKFYLN